MFETSPFAFCEQWYRESASSRKPEGICDCPAFAAASVQWNLIPNHNILNLHGHLYILLHF